MFIIGLCVVFCTKATVSVQFSEKAIKCKFSVSPL